MAPSSESMVRCQREKECGSGHGFNHVLFIKLEEEILKDIRRANSMFCRKQEVCPIVLSK